MQAQDQKEKARAVVHACSVLYQEYKNTNDQELWEEIGRLTFAFSRQLNGYYGHDIVRDMYPKEVEFFHTVMQNALQDYSIVTNSDVVAEDLYNLTA